MGSQLLFMPAMGAAAMHGSSNGISVPAAAASPSMRPLLPDRKVTGSTIEDAYVDFILHCNPAVPADVDTAALREAFRTPPKSGGKSFSTFTLFGLIKQLEAKELKTWAELALKLGVEPPDQDKGQSSQKIQQYAVRLKRWMHSMHVDTFFKYLMDSPHPYWTEIPTETEPSLENGRDGVAAEDDMALRALLPHIRPRRGRRRPEDNDLSKSPSQRPRLDETPVAPDDLQRPAAMHAWSAHPDGRQPAFMFDGPHAVMLQPRSGQPGSGVLPWASADMTAQTPLTAFPRSAITPSTGATFWPEEPRSAVTPSRPRPFGKRHGAKVVSSAWKSAGSGKVRGRPPASRQANDGPFSAFPAAAGAQTFKLPSPRRNTTLLAPDASSSPAMAVPPVNPAVDAAAAAAAAASAVQRAQPATNGRPTKPNRLSLQVPERVGGEVRLATPPPVLMLNGQATTTTATHDAASAPEQLHEPAQPGVHTGPQPPAGSAIGIATTHEPPSATIVLPPAPPPEGNDSAPGPPAPTPVQFRDPSDSTNLDGLQAFWVHEIVRADWFDGDQPAAAPCPVAEAFAIAFTVVETIRLRAVSPESFLMNLAVLCGGKILMTTSKLRCTRLRVLADRTNYKCEWELRLRDVRAVYKMEETVLHRLWKTGEGGGGQDDAEPAGAGQDAEPAAEGPVLSQSAEAWQQRYKDLLELVVQKEKALAEITNAGLESLKVHSQRRDAGGMG